ncbi:MAG: 2-isopropylmalate synthase [Desulfobacula sp.]|jgi:2-isopropylmalate synthase|uniref:2-isopropylmalate synthase n=2 Tax=Desulfobacula sp. TaxID=2593537 RepID=UPI001DCEC7A9|nr:2-isopropylmalate synthase [Desulfobacula sp.]MBT3806365.1 2-isopropylmalate synthase [Desulfobacula sp.]MBT4025918.1 2-isopropylmalate synthase [Desulfobacula sp.]MBT4200917.1 2-isopropylmalate synthase [Desulfobacula sp.]MBT4507532.1 2-isopropylmalate synthase [Desulfobacula sp.]
MKQDSQIIIFDTTLRDGEQSPGASMNKAEKLRIATQLEKLGVNVIEAGFPAASEGDFEAVKKIAQTLKISQVAALCRTNEDDIKKGWEAIKDAAHPRIHTFIATSELHMKYKLSMEPSQVLEQAVKSVKLAASYTDNVEFSAEDGSRSDPPFLCKVFEAVIDAGATTVNLPDTVGYAIPEEFAELVKYVMENTPNMDKAVLSVHCHNDLGLATSNTLAAIKAGARQVEVTINGIGERAGNTSLEEVVMSLATRPNFFPQTTSIVTKRIYPTSRLVSMITGILVQPNRAIVGANAFAHEAGIHQDGVLKNPMTYEIMKPETIGLSKNNLVLGKHSGRHALNSHIQEMGYNLSKEELDLVFQKFKNLADKKKSIQDEDIEALINEGILRSSEVFSLEYIHVLSGNTVFPTASVQLNINGRKAQGATEGNGPIDAVYNIISKLTNTKSELLRFTISALTEGTDAQGEVTVRLQEDGIVALGKGADPDIITASALAYINGLNRLEYLKEHPVVKPENL